MKSIFLIIKILIFGVVVFMAALTLFVSLPLKTPFKMFIVLSGSMDPTIPAGAVVLVERQTTQFQGGDIITFIHPDNPRAYITHRVIGIREVGNSFNYLTKGDANNSEDLWMVKKEAVWGKVNFTLPYLGYLLSFSKTKPGVILMIAIPLLIVAASEIMVIKKEYKRLKNAKIKLPNLENL